MSSIRRDSLYILFAAVLAATLTPCVGHADAIRFMTKVKVGDRFAIKADCERTTLMERSVGGQAAPSEPMKMKAAIEGTMEVTAVDEDGYATKANLIVSKMAIGIQETVRALESERSWSVEDSEKGIRFREPDGKELEDPILTQLLRLMIEMPSGSRDILNLYSGDAGTIETGASVAVEPMALVRNLARDGVGAEAEKVTGKATVTKTEDHDGVSCYRVETELGASDMQLPQGMVPAGKKVSKAEFSSQIRLLIPIEPDQPILTFDQILDQEVNITGRVGAELMLEIFKQVEHRTIHREFSRID